MCENTVFITDFTLDKDAKELSFSSLYTAELKDENVDFKCIIPDKEEKYTIEDFRIWLDSPCSTTEMVDIPYRDAIKFLQSYRKDTFRTDNYLFYVKRDKALKKNII